MYDASVDYDAIEKSYILNIHKYLMVKNKMFGLIKKVFIGLLNFIKSLSSIVNTPDHVKCISLNNQQCMTQPTLINSHPNEYIEGLRYYPFAVNLDRRMGSCNTLNDLSNKACVPNKTEDLNFSVLTLFRIGRWGDKKPSPYQLFPCNFYKRRN